MSEEEYTLLEAEADFFQLPALMSEIQMHRNDIPTVLRLRIGEVLFTVSRDVITREVPMLVYEELERERAGVSAVYNKRMQVSLFRDMFVLGKIPVSRDKDGAYIIDGNSDLFPAVLTYIRTGTFGGDLTLPDGKDFKDYVSLRAEALYYGLPGLVNIAEFFIWREKRYPKDLVRLGTLVADFVYKRRCHGYDNIKMDTLPKYS